ncbi:MAG: ABC transporter permease [Clostridiales bacterium]|nr:ABC transporter permease [Clostridiales bacterium]
MSIKRALVYALLVLLAVWLGLKAARVPGWQQHVFLAPSLAAPVEDQEVQDPEEGQDRQAPSPLEQFLHSFDSLLEETGDSHTAALLSAHLPGAGLSTPQGGSAQAELTALYGQLHTYPQAVLVSGRHLYQEEVDLGRPVAVIDEALAIALFRQGDPVGMRFELQSTPFTVVGVVRHSRQPGERAEYGLRVPLLAFEQVSGFEVMAATLVPKGGSGTRSGLASALNAWRPGQSIDLVKESYRALLPLRALLCALGMALAVIGLKLASRLSARLVSRARGWLERDYVVRLLPRYALVGLAIALMFGAGLALLLFAFTQLLEVVYVFPEWVPAILVEPREIARTFWDNQSRAAGLVSLRSRELLYLRALGGWLGLIALVMGGLLIAPLSRLYHRVKEV